MPDHPSIQQLLGEATAHYHSGDYQQAILAWRQVLVTEPNNQRAKEGIRMASLLLEEAQAAAEASHEGPGRSAESFESEESIARVREGIQKVREHLASSRYLEAMEVCQSLLILAPRSAAVHEIVDEAREAYEAQPFINEHLEIARQLFVQERLEDASAELHKIFFLNPNHAGALKLEEKILVLKQKRTPGAILTGPAEPGQDEPERPAQGSAPAAGGDSSADTGRFALPPDFGDTVDLPQEPPSPAPAATESGAGDRQSPGETGQTAGAAAEDPALNENWEAELAQLDLGGPHGPPVAPSSDAPAHEAGTPEPSAGASRQAAGDPEPPLGTQPPAPETPEPEEKLSLMDLSEDPRLSAPRGDGVREDGKPSAVSGTSPAAERVDGDLDLAALIEEQERPAAAPPEIPVLDEEEEIPSRPVPARHRPPPSRGSSRSITRFLLPLAGILIGGGAAWWYFGPSPASSGNPGNPSPPPPVRAPHAAGALGSRAGGPGSGANLGLSSGSSRGSGDSSPAGVQVPGVGAAPAAPPPPLSPEQSRQEIARLSGEGRSLMERGRYQEAVKAFSKALDMDPANMDAKDLMDQATSKILEQRKLEEDLQTAKEFFVEKDYESALRKFYRLPRDRNLGELDLFIRNAWYNWAVVAMKGGNCVEALQRLQEALTVDPVDKEAQKQQEVAEHYRDRPKDRVFYAFVDRLTFRTLNQR